MRLLKNLISALAIAVATVGCSGTQAPPFRDVPPDVEPITLDENFTEDERDAILTAAAQWNQAVGKYVQFTFAGTVPHDKVDAKLEELDQQADGLVVMRHDPAEEDVCGPGALACASLRGHFMSFNPEVVGTRMVKDIALHELGHHLGINHINIRDSLMFPVYQGVDCIDQETLKALATARPTFRLEEMVSDCH